ncbi:MAG: RsmB/NOP family class I SAM-dependent RNA methyltransferase [Desulfovibrionaceae bacterium]
MKVLRLFRIVASEENISFVEELLQEEGFIFEAEKFCLYARRLLDEPIPLGRSIAHYFGYIYIQDKSSMLVPLLLNPPKGNFVLDMCASPGSKTGLTAHLVDIEGAVLGNEPNKSRLGTLQKTLQTTNSINTATCSYKGDNFPFISESISSIILDPPCSGWGTENKNPNVRSLWKGKKIEPLQKLQRKLLQEASRLLKHGGELIYSTCTTNSEENEDNIQFAVDFLGLEVLPIAMPEGFIFEESSLSSCKNTYTVIPNEEHQGFFVAKLIKRGFQSSLNNVVLLNSMRESEIDMALLEDMDINLFQYGRLAVFSGNVYFLHKEIEKHITEEMRWKGFLLGANKGGVFRPCIGMRSFYKRKKDIPKSRIFCVDTVSEIQKLLSGQSNYYKTEEKILYFYWKELFLSVLFPTNNRLFWSK